MERQGDVSMFYTICNSSIDKICEDIENKKHKIICLNDGEKTRNFAVAKQRIISSLDKRYRKKSSFEL